MPVLRIESNVMQSSQTFEIYDDRFAPPRKMAKENTQAILSCGPQATFLMDPSFEFLKTRTTGDHDNSCFPPESADHTVVRTCGCDRESNRDVASRPPVTQQNLLGGTDAPPV